MSVAIKDRPIESVREEVIDQLIMNYSHGEISLEAFESRLDQAMNGTDTLTISELTKDLNLSADTKYQDKKKSALGTHYQQGKTKELDKLLNVFSSSTRKGQWNVPKKITLINIFGSDELDFTQAKFTHPSTQIEVLCVFGSVDISVPEDVNTHSNVNCILGSIENDSTAEFSADAPTISIEGKVIFGSLDIKIKQPIKEKWLRFADSLKALFN